MPGQALAVSATYVIASLAPTPIGSATASRELITFDVQGTIKLTEALPLLFADIDIQGPGSSLLTVRPNTAGAHRIFDNHANVSISGMTISSGFASFGGGIHNTGMLTLFRCVVSNNYAVDGAGGIYNGNTLNILESTISGNTGGSSGGGVYSSGTLTLTDSTVWNNSAPKYNGSSYGGGIFSSGSLYVLNSTISSNRTVVSGGLGIGGGIYATGTLKIENSTITKNEANESGSGVDGSSFILKNSIVSGNTGGASDVSGSYSGDHNVIGGNALLGVLADNCGPTKTHALLPGSPAIDAGDNTDAPEWDQRGPGYTRIVNDIIDIGAFEVQATGAPETTHDLAVLITADFGDTRFKARRPR